jgi:hypothetical protein
MSTQTSVEFYLKEVSIFELLEIANDVMEAMKNGQ